MDNINEEIDELLEALAKKMGISKAEVIKKGVKLLDLINLEAEKAQKS